MSPISGVITGPNRSDALRPGEKGAREDKRTIAVVSSLDALRGGHVVVHAESVVHFAMLDAAVMNQVFLHRNFGTVEHGRLVHIVPNVQVFRRSFVGVQRKLARPPLANVWIRDVQVRRTSRPAPPVKIRRAVVLLDVKPFILCLFIDGIIIVDFYVRIHDGDHLSSATGDVVDHAFGRGERTVVPRHVPLPIGVFDVEPKHVIRYVICVETGVDFLDVVLVAIVPSALMIAERK